LAHRAFVQSTEDFAERFCGRRGRLALAAREKIADRSFPHAIVIRRLAWASGFPGECGFPVIYFDSDIFFPDPEKYEPLPSWKAFR
jgi:hypothetical protein